LRFCSIRGRPRERQTFAGLTYRQFREAAEPLACGARRYSGFAAGERAAIIMTNQPKWLISAYAAFFFAGRRGGNRSTIQLSAEEHLQLPSALESAGSVRGIIRTGRANYAGPKHFASISCTRSWLPEGAAECPIWQAGLRWGKSVAPAHVTGNFASRFANGDTGSTACIVYFLW